MLYMQHVLGDLKSHRGIYCFFARLQKACALYHCTVTRNGWGNLLTLTLMPSNRDRALRGLKARRVLRDLMAPRSENPMALATRLTSET